MIIRGEKIDDTAILTPTRELLFAEKNEQGLDFIKEECCKSFQKGQERGERVGYERALNETTALLGLLQTMTDKLLEQKKHLLEQLKPEVIECAIAICERVIRKELSQPEVLVQLINSLLAISTQHLQHDTIQIVLAPDDLMILENHLNQIQYDRREINGIRFTQDSLMKRGDCRIETKSGLLNHDISRELFELQSKVLQG